MPTYSDSLVQKLTNATLPLRPSWLLGKFVYSRTTRVVIDSVSVGVALGLSYWIRFDGKLSNPYEDQLLRVLPVTVFLYVVMNHFWGVYRLVWHFVGRRDAGRIAVSVVCSALLLVIGNAFHSQLFHQTRIPLGVSLLHPILVYGFWIGMRGLRRITHHGEWGKSTKRKPDSPHRLVLLIGAGKAGFYFSRELSQNREFKIVGFLDDNPELTGRSIEGYRVLGTTRELRSTVEKAKVDEVILCMPSAPNSVCLRIAACCQQLPVRLSSVPTLSEILLGRANIARFREVQMEQLLGRESISFEPDEELINTYRGRRILVTGAAGSIGSELARQLRKYDPEELILLDKDESGIHETSLELQEDFPRVVPLVANIREFDRVERIFSLWRPEVVFHAAAYKHVPLMENHPSEAILNNVFGTKTVIDLSEKYGVRNFVLISTDKAINPSSIMGASKRIAEMMVQQYASNGAHTCYCGVRFGNVLGSRASVVPLFQRRIREGKSITVTHPDVKRYFMTIPEATQLVIQAGSLGRRGEIFLLDMGDPVKILDLAENLIALSGLTPHEDIKIEFSGLRPGEKLFEELFSRSESRYRSTKYPKIFVVDFAAQPLSYLENALTKLEQAAHCDDVSSIQNVLTDLEIGYHMNANKIEVVLRKAAASASVLP